MTAKRASGTAKSTRVFGQRQETERMFRAGLYARVSTHDQQTLPLQMRAMREYAAKRGWTITVQIKEVGSGAAERELRENLLAAARGREIDVVLVWRLDRCLCLPSSSTRSSARESAPVLPKPGSTENTWVGL